MTISAAGSTASILTQRLVNMRSQFDDLQRQLSTGQKSDTYAGLGLDRGLTVSLNAQSAQIGSYNTTIDNVMTRINVAQNALTAIDKVSSGLGSALSQGTDSPTNGNTTQISAQSWLQQLVGLLNTQVGDRYVFSGSATDTPSTASYDQIINGGNGRDGLTTVISERNRRRPRRQRPRPVERHQSDPDVGAGRRRRRVALRLQAQRDHLEPEQRHRQRSERLAPLGVGEFHGPAQRRPDRDARAQSARWHHHQLDADGDDQFTAGRQSVHHRRVANCDGHQSADRAQHSARDGGQHHVESRLHGAGVERFLRQPAQARQRFARHQRHQPDHDWHHRQYGDLVHGRHRRARPVPRQPRASTNR